MASRTLILEIIGTITIILLGNVLHFTYASSGNNPLVAAFSAVNESIWEHLKLAFWPSLLWMLIVMGPLRKTTNNYFFAKTAGSYVMVAFIPLVFYSYTSFTGESIFAIDIASFIVAVIIGQIFSYKLLSYKALPEITETASIVAVILLATIFALFTFSPPQLPLFQDPITGHYGV